MSTKLRWFIFILLALVLALPQGPATAQRRGPRSRVGELQVQLKVQAITKENFFMGDVWVAPPKFTDIQMGAKYLGQARAVTLDPDGNLVNLSGTWEPSDPAMVMVNPTEGHEVKFAVIKAGQSNLRVTVDQLSQQVIIKAVYQDGAIHVEISQ
ncbi:MAG: hypothetical protein ACYDIC_15550 [Desulfobaccales bacterium]